MLVSTKGRYALRVMIDLAENRSDRYIPLKEVAQRQEISEKYLEIIIKDLVKAGLVDGVRGKGGGYKLTREPEDYVVGDILRIMEGSISPVSCLEEGALPCSRAPVCRTLPMWLELDKVINEYLDSVTLDQLMRPEPGAGVGAGLAI